MKQDLLAKGLNFSLPTLSTSSILQDITFYLFLNWYSMRVSNDRKYICSHRLYACRNTQKLNGLDCRKITSLPDIEKVIYMARHFNHG